MRTCLKYAFLAVLAIILMGCHTTKFVPEDKYLLNKAKVHVEDTKAVNGENLKNYLRQRPNTTVMGFWKLQLDIWNTQRGDSAKWINRQIRKLGEPPEIYDEALTEASMMQLKRAMDNKGYFSSEVDTAITIKDRKLNIVYNITAGDPYHLRDYNISLPHAELNQIAQRRSNISPGMLFDADVLDAERERIADVMRIRGYYYFEKDYLTYEADSSFGERVVDVRLKLLDYLKEQPDSVQRKVFTQYKIKNVVFYTNSAVAEENEQAPDTVVQGDYIYLYAGRKLLRERVLRRRCKIVPGERYNLRRVEQTYTALNALAPVKYVSISFVPAGEDELTCVIVISRNKIHGVTAEVEGTFSAGDWGIAAGVGYTNRNLFRGAEELSLNGRVSYEWRQNGGRALEAKAEAGLRFPSNVKLNVGYNYQQRPEEFTRTIANAGVSYHLISGRRQNWRHTFNLLDISYVYLPWISDRFRAEFLKPTNILKYSYEDHFIMDWSYALSYSSYRRNQPLRNYGTFAFSVETAGNFLYGISNLFKLPQNEDGKYEIFKIPYAQYVKGDINFTYHQIFNKANRLVYHVGLGVAVPFGNAEVIPFEKRYFAGGANSVRGWTIRSLGPGGYRGTGDRIDFNNQSGDIKLDLNLEYRLKLIWVLEMALFTDAGNIWTIRDYDSQPYGQFKFTEFYKQLAWSYGIGLRLNFDIFVFRVDFGVKLYDPSRINYDGRFDSETDFGGPWRTVSNGLCWKDDMSFHFAIGYPF